MRFVTLGESDEDLRRRHVMLPLPEPTSLETDEELDEQWRHLTRLHGE